MDLTSFNQIVIHSAALENNFKLIQKTVGMSVPVMAMVKADAYGHGSVKTAEAFARAGCSRFGVAELREAVLLRKAGLAGKIYVTIGFAPENAGYFFEYDLIPVIYSVESAKALSAAAVSLNRQIAVHVKVDTGMGRLGFLPADVPAFFELIDALPGLTLAGIMSHFPTSDIPESRTTLKGIELFNGVCSTLKNRGGGSCHIANSAAVLNFPDAYHDMVRAGIALYGYHPAGKTSAGELREGCLQQAMSFTSKVLQVKKVPAGTGVSYGHTYVTPGETNLAVIPVGYEDGLSRSLSNKAEVLIGGKRAMIRGRICMNMCMADITGIEGVQAGDDAVFLGRQGTETISADDIAEKMDSISYEVLCMFGHNNNRNYQVG
ncbi:alanine racemase [Desulforhopalus sp. IMCC35007]|uniref:alanine racemase n=1 Tax=Desulforhopalus sp. IMCC35007 TaxID=2569543 RepID=UPI0010AEC770|nr:alanine racemase [Desulforhopalus sp. IMCC35007]TKB09050.1 alanine racemase [Desulforhopalus sp. IMCC35007]